MHAAGDAAIVVAFPHSVGIDGRDWHTFRCAESACRANETVAQAETTKNAKATLTELLDTGKAPKSIR